MNYLDFLCLWIGYAICALALVRTLIDSVFATRRAWRRMVRWFAPRMDVMTLADFEERKRRELSKPLP